MRIRGIRRAVGIGLFLLYSSPNFADVETLKDVIDTQVKTEQAAKNSQQKIDKLDDESAQMLAEYRSLLRQTESLQAYNDQLDKLVGSQKSELKSIIQQLENIETTQREIVPLMLNMINVLEQFIALDIPFLPEERQQRVEQLHVLMERADVSLAEKYRRVLEAYQVETEYGRTIEAYQGEMEHDGEVRTVDFLRIGRLSLYYLTLDGQEAGYWHQGWQPLDSSYRKEIEKGLKVAKKQLPPDMLVLPVHTQEKAQ
jgi:septal ring factor EnvC (AmiA/AmiB activator)